MLAIAGTYNNGILILEKPLATNKPVKVIVTFLEEEQPSILIDKPLNIADFSFAQARELLKDAKGKPLSAIVIEERRSYL